MTIAPKGYYCDVATRKELPILIMDAKEIKEREDLRIANTSQALRTKVVSASNGHAIKPMIRCSECGRDTHGYIGSIPQTKKPLCRYCDPKAYTE